MRKNLKHSSLNLVAKQRAIQWNDKKNPTISELHKFVIWNAENAYSMHLDSSSQVKNNQAA